jgi:hypothetical protein
MPVYPGAIQAKPPAPHRSQTIWRWVGQAVSPASRFIHTF